MVKELNDLVHFAKTSVWRDETLLASFCDQAPGVLLLYRVLWSNSLQTDAAVARTAGLSLSTYKILARRLRRHLREMTVFFNDEKAKVDATVKNYVEGALDVALMNTLHGRGYRHAPLEIAKRLYRRGLDYEAPAFAAEALRVLKESVLSVEGNEKQFEEYSRLFWEYRAHADAEERAADCFQWVKLPYLRRKSVRHHLPELTRQRIEALEPYKGRTPSYMFHVYYYTIRGNFLLETADYEGALRCYDEAIAYFRAKRYPVVNPLAMFHYSKVMACIPLGRYEAGEAAVMASLDCAPDGSFNFFNAYETYYYLAIHTGHYAQALDIFQTVTLHKRFGNLRAPQRETWHILGAYLFVVYRLADLPLPERGLPPFKSYRFANETQAFARDKNGMNVAILIVHLLLQLIEGKYDEVLERISALDKYRERYLREADSDRSEWFIKILMLLLKTGFDAAAFLKKATPLRKKMAAHPRQFTNPVHELEVVPYETLVDLLAGYLRKKNSPRAEAG